MALWIMKWFLILYVYNQILDIEYFSKFLQEIFILLILNERYYQIKYYILNKWITRGLIFKDIKIIKLCNEEWFSIRRVSISPYSVYHTLKNFLKPSTPFISTIPNLLKSLLMLFSSYIYICIYVSNQQEKFFDMYTQYVHPLDRVASRATKILRKSMIE